MVTSYTTSIFKYLSLKVRYRYLGNDPDPERKGKYWRVITLEDGETIHNAFRDRSVKIM